VSATGFDDRVDDGAAITGGGFADEEPVLFAERSRTDGLATCRPNGHQYATQSKSIRTMPPGIPFIVGNEAAEQFSFYGMRSILIVFMTYYLVTLELL